MNRKNKNQIEKERRTKKQRVEEFSSFTFLFLGSKVAAHHVLKVPSKKEIVLKFRLYQAKQTPEESFGVSFDKTFEQRLFEYKKNKKKQRKDKKRKEKNRKEKKEKNLSLSIFVIC